MQDLSVQDKERAILIGLVTQYQTVEQLEEYLDELAFLAQTAGAEVIERFYQKLTTPEKRTYIGKGKLEEVQRYVEEKDIDLVLIDDEISPAQLRNIEEAVKVK